MNGAFPLAILLLAFAVAGAARGQDEPRTGPGQPSIEVVLHGDANGGSVEFGAPFEFDVVRRWPIGAVPEPWRDDALAPLVLRAGAVLTGESGNEMVETRRFRAFAFRRGAVTLQPGFALVTGDGEPAVRATATPRVLLVESALPIDDDGKVEPPPAPPLHVAAMRAELVVRLVLASVAGALLWLLLVLWRVARRWRQVDASPRDRLLAQLEQLAAQAPDSRAAWRAEAVAATSILRTASRCLDDAQFRVDPRVHASLEAVKFAGTALPPAERQALFAELRRIVASVPRERAPGGREPRTGAA